VITLLIAINFFNKNTNKILMRQLQSAIIGSLSLPVTLALSWTVSWQCRNVSALCRSGFYHLRQLRPVTRSLTPAAAQTVVQAFISCRL